MRKLLLAATMAAIIGVAVAVPVANADYGNTAQYQAAVSLNCNNKTAAFCTEQGGLGGIWQWFAFNNDGSFDSTETFCAHNDPEFGSGAFHFNGDGTWTVGPATDEAPPFGQTEDFYVDYQDGNGPQDSGVPYLEHQSMHYSAKLGPGISAEAQVAYIPNR